MLPSPMRDWPQRVGWDYCVGVDDVANLWRKVEKVEHVEICIQKLKARARWCDFEFSRIDVVMLCVQKLVSCHMWPDRKSRESQSFFSGYITWARTDYHASCQYKCQPQVVLDAKRKRWAKSQVYIPTLNPAWTWLILTWSQDCCYLSPIETTCRSLLGI